MSGATLTRAFLSVDNSALLHKYVNMRTSIDFPDVLFRTLKASAAMHGTSLRDHVLQLIERGMQLPEQSQAKREPRSIPPIPTIDFGTLPPELITNNGINEFLMNEEYENYVDVMKYGRSSEAESHEAG
jgi:hypothetical protein